MTRRTVTPLNEGWHFKQTSQDASEYLPVAQFPTNVHLDLMHHKLIPDPNMGKNEQEVQWVGETSWTYKTTFTSPALSDGAKAVLVFDGLDTFATVELNGKEVLSTDNMFIQESVDVSKAISGEGKTNDLVIHFDSAFFRGHELVKANPDHKWGCWNGDNSRLPVRKAQYHWGWDWGPMLMTCGPWRPIHLEVYESCLNDLYAEITVDDSLRSAEVVAHASVEGSGAHVRFDVFFEGEKVATETVKAGGDAVTTFAIQNPKLWYPVGYGEQPLYTVSATLIDSEGQELDSASKRIGLRKTEVIEKPFKDSKQSGSSFFFRINNVDIFCGGSNWIPADNFIPRITKERYFDWVKLLVDGNQVMLRVWAGGIFEEQALYDACDEMGILVWQDFLFGCGNYPCDDRFVKSVQREAEYNVKRLRHHPSIAIWAGNNEDYAYAESVNLTYDYEDKDPDSWRKTDFPARYIYEHVLSEVCKELVPSSFYHPGSPWGGGKNSSDPTVGDIHQWNVWHGRQERYQDFGKLIGRFVSEFGMEAFPSAKTIDGYLLEGKNDPDRFPQSSTVDFHNKAAGHERRLALYLVENIRYKFDPLEDYVYCTQLMQADCLSSAYRNWRREWVGPDERYCGGVLVWQINDCWPVTSWSICDYHLRPKHAYFAIKREMAPVVIGLERKTGSNPSRENSGVMSDYWTKINIWGSNLSHKDVKVRCTYRCWDIKAGEEVGVRRSANDDLVLASNKATEISDLTLHDSVFKTRDGASQVVIGAFLHEGETEIARYIDWPQPLKYVHFAKPQNLQVKLSEDCRSVEVSAEVPVKGLALDCEDDEVKVDDNLVDLVPGEVVRIGVKGAKKETVFTTQCLNCIV